jgi:hypothetical protein
MRIAKPLLLVSTPIGVAWGLLEAYRLAGGLVILMAAMVGTMAAAAGSVVAIIRRERAAGPPSQGPSKEVQCGRHQSRGPGVTRVDCHESR